MMNVLSRPWRTQVLSAKPTHSNWLSVVLWWEIRRIPYNIVVGVVGAISLVSTFFLIAASGDLKPGEDAIEPIAWIGLPLLSGIFFNVCYTAGWVVELLLRSASHENQSSIGPLLFVAGLLLSLAIVLLPVVYWATYDVLRWLHLLASTFRTGG